MQSTTSLGQRRRRWALIVGTGGTTLVAAAALSSAAGAATTPPANPGLGASGSVAALNASSSSMEVQNANSGQTTVSWTSTTQFSKTVSEAASALAGDCVTVTGTPSKKDKTTIAARSITVSNASSSGSCSGFGTRNGSGANGAAGGGPQGGFQFRGGGNGGGRPGFGGSNAEGGGSFSRGGTGNGSSNFRKQLASIAIASGKVKSVKGSTLTVSGFSLSPGQFSPASAKSSSKTKKPTPPKTQTLTITTSKSTTVSATQSAAATDLAVGDCVTAFGPAASNGAVTANTVRITSTGGASCTTGFGRFGGGGGGGFFGGPGGGAAGGGGGGGA
jgi:hypothetical protein